MGDLQKYVQATVTEILQAMKGLTEAEELQGLGVTAFPLIAHADDLTSVGIFKSQTLTNEGKTEHRPIICFQFDIAVEAEEQTTGKANASGGLSMKVLSFGKASANAAIEHGKGTAKAEANRVKFTIPLQIRPSQLVADDYAEGAKKVFEAERVAKERQATTKTMSSYTPDGYDPLE